MSYYDSVLEETQVRRDDIHRDMFRKNLKEDDKIDEEVKEKYKDLKKFPEFVEHLCFELAALNNQNNIQRNDDWGIYDKKELERLYNAAICMLYVLEDISFACYQSKDFEKLNKLWQVSQFFELMCLERLVSKKEG